MSKKTAWILVVSVVLISALIIVFLFVRPKMLRAVCAANLRNISEDALSDFRADYFFIEGKPYYKNKLNLSTNFPKKFLICPVCKEPYIYSAISPSGNRIPTWSDIEKKEFVFFVMWCPKPCHNNKRNFLRWDSKCLPPLGDNEVSWYYQKEARCLTKEELEKENEYRKSHHMEILQNNR